MITVIDKVEDNYRQNMGFEIKKKVPTIKYTTVFWLSSAKQKD